MSIFASGVLVSSSSGLELYLHLPIVPAPEASLLALVSGGDGEIGHGIQEAQFLLRLHAARGIVADAEGVALAAGSLVLGVPLVYCQSGRDGG